MNHNKNFQVNRLIEIDILRGLAAFAVFLFHSSTVSGFAKRTLPSFEAFGYQFSNIPNIFSFGASGVNLFFLLSGFCLALKPIGTGLVLIDIKTYYRDRFARIYPAYFVAVLFSILVAITIHREWKIFEAISVLGFMQGFIQEWHFSLNGALWSMSTEVQFYLAFPLLFFAFTRLQPLKFITIVVVLVFLYRFFCANIESADIVLGGIRTDTFLMNLLPGRMFEFSLGILLAYYWVADKDRLAKFCKKFFLVFLLIAVFARMKLSTAIADPLLGLMCLALTGLALTINFLIQKPSLASNIWQIII